MNETTSLGEALPKEQARCRKLILQCKSIGPECDPLAHLIEIALQITDKAVIVNDVVAMLKSYEELKGFKA